MIEGVAIALAGMVAIVIAEFITRRSPGQRIGRTLAAARDVQIEDALRIAAAGEQRYVRVHGRISSEEEFPDEHDRPLVYRRKRIDRRGPDRRWTTLDAETEGVPFGIESREAFIAVDSAQLGEGLVVVPRESEGVAGDLPPGAAALIDPQTPARLVIEQVSAVEHATVAGVPRLGPDGKPQVSSGFGRPLILTTLELSEAMRLLGKGGRGSAVASGVLIVAGLLAIVLGVLLIVAPVFIQPALAESASPAPLPTPFDPRGGGVGPGVVGAPFAALLTVVGLGIVTVLATLLYVRLARSRR